MYLLVKGEFVNVILWLSCVQYYLRTHQTTRVCVCHCLQGWLCDVEDMMHATLKDTLRACRADLKKHLAKREKWVRDWPGQMLITSSQIQWTADCEKALDRGDKKGLKTLKKKQVS